MGFCLRGRSVYQFVNLKHAFGKGQSEEGALHFCCVLVVWLFVA